MQQFSEMSSLPGIQSVGQIMISCEDVARATAIYRDVLGLQFLYAPGPDFAFLMAGDVRIMLANPEEDRFLGTSVLYLKVDNVKASLDSIRSSAVIVQEPHMIADMGSYELWMAFFKDTEDNIHAFMEERKKDASL